MAIKTGSLLSKSVRKFPLAWKNRMRLPIPAGWGMIVLTSMTVTALVLGARQLGWLQPSELAAYDLMVRLRPNQEPDPRLLVVAITEADIKRMQQWPMTDQVVAQLLANLQRHHPRAIGLDLFRNISHPPGQKELAAEFKKDNVIAISYIGNSQDETIAPPPGIPEERIGFSDVLTDPDGAVRRNLFFAYDGKKDALSFSFQLALTYLDAEKISPEINQNKEVYFKQVTFKKLQADRGGYQTIKTGNYQILLNYRSSDQVAREVTLSQVLDGEIKPEWVKDKIVLIGAKAPSLKDLFYTPYRAIEGKNRKMSGIVIHAQMVSQILSAVLDNRPLFWFWPKSAEILWIVGWSLLGGIIGWRINNPLVLMVGEIVIIGILLGTTFFLFMNGGWIPLVAPSLGLIISGSLAISYQVQQARGQQQIVMKLLGQQTSPEIAAALWNNRDRLLNSGILPGQRLTATIILTDLKGFSTISEKSSPEWAMKWLNQYLGIMTEEVCNHHGIVNKFTGDGLLAIFGVPIPRTTEAEVAVDAQQAVNCALAMGKQLKELNRQWQQQGLPMMEMRVGIFTGHVMVGSLGGKDRLEYGVIGDSVNTASRLESYDKDRQMDTCRILIGKETLVYLEEKFLVEFWGSLELKGKERPVDVYRVLGHAMD